jgi:hypothetical protein
LRDANQNITINSSFNGFTSVAASGTQITLTAASTPVYLITGSGGQIIKLPDATTLPNGVIFSFNNNQSIGAITVNNNSNTLVVSVPSGGYTTVVLLSNATAAGSWDRHDQTPANVSWSTNTFDYAGSITSATWNGNAVAVNRGGTGLSTLTAGSITYGAGISAYVPLAIGTAGQVLTVNSGATAPSWVTPSTVSGSVVVGTTAVTSGTSGYILYNNAGTLGNLATVGTGSVVLSASPTLTGTLTTSSITANGSLQLIGNDVADQNIGTGQFTTALNIGGLTGAGTINIGPSADGAAINIATTSATSNTVQIGATNGTGDLIFGSSSATQSVSIGTGAGNAVTIGPQSSSNKTINIGGISATGTITLGRSTAAQTVNIASNANSSATKTINIGTGSSGGATNIAIGATSGTSTTTLNGKTSGRIVPRVSTTTSSATPTINTDNTDQYGLTAQAVDITSFTTNLSGTPTDGQKLWIYIVGTAARAITWGASFEASTVALPTTTVSTNRLDVGFVWNAATSKWRCVAVA